MTFGDTIPNGDGFICRLKDLKQGDFFRLNLTETGAVYVRDFYIRGDAKYNTYKYEDVCAERGIKGDRLVWAGFTF